MSKLTTAPATLAQNVERSVYTAVASAAALLLADGAAKGVTGISVPDWKAALTALGAGVLTAAKNAVIGYLANHKSLKAQVTALEAEVKALQTPSPA
jgi:hypothetical protein